MPDKIDVKRFASWVDELWRAEKVCPICRSNRWTISDDAAELRVLHGGNLVVGGPVYPLVVVTCGVCGNTLLFNAIVSKAIEPQRNEELSRPVPAEAQPAKKEEK